MSNKIKHVTPSIFKERERLARRNAMVPPTRNSASLVTSTYSPLWSLGILVKDLNTSFSLSSSAASSRKQHLPEPPFAHNLHEICSSFHSYALVPFATT